MAKFDLAKNRLTKLAALPVLLLASAPTFAASLIDWTLLSAGVVTEATAAIAAGITVLALFFGVSGSVKMFRKFIG